MRIKMLIVVLATLALVACADDPIIGPTDDDTSGGGSYGVIHFSTSPDEASGRPSDRDIEKKENPERF